MISVIIPVYNAAPFLRECLKGLSGCEVICVDDGSTDGSGELLEQLKIEYGLKDCRIVHQANAGLSAARNRGIQEVHGDYVMFLDADDVIKHEALVPLDALLERTSYPDVVQFNLVGQKPYVKRERLLATPREIRKYQDDVTRLPGIGLCSCKLYRWKMVEDLRFDPKIVGGEDTLYAVQAIRRAKRILLSPIPFYFYRVVDGSLSHRPFPGIVPVVERMLELLRQEVGDCPAYYDHAFMKFEWCAGVSELSRKELAARPLFAEALRKTALRRFARWVISVPGRAYWKTRRLLGG